MSDISFVFFDLDDTLLDHHYAQDRSLEEIYQKYLAGNGISLAALKQEYKTINRRFWQEYRDGNVGKEEVRFGRFRDLLSAIGAQDDHVDVTESYMSAYSRHWRYCSGAFPAFAKVARRFGVGIITNGFLDVQQAKLRRFPEIAERSSYSLISEELGVLKPHSKIFETASAKVEIEPKRLLYIGDSFTSDVVGALNAGWRAAWYNPQMLEVPIQTSRDFFQFSDWQQLLDRVVQD